jgi:hypothetical protein
MCKKFEKHLKHHKTAYLVALVIALFVTATMLLSRSAWVSQMTPGLRGNVLMPHSPYSIQQIHRPSGKKK